MIIDSENTVVWPTPCGHQLAAFDAGYSHGQDFGPSITRYSRTRGRPGSFSQEGAILGPAPGPYCGLVKVAPHDVVGLNRIEGRRTRERFYRVLPDSRIVPLEPEDYRGFRERIPEPDVEGPDDLEVLNDDLERLFAAQVPKWLEPALSAQLRHWRKHHVEHYFRYTPITPDRSELWACIRGAPFQALTRFGHLLQRPQIRLCASRTKRTSVIFGSEGRHDRAEREQILIRHAEDALRHGSDRLSEEELIGCAALKPHAAIRFCKSMTGRTFVLAVTSALTQLRSRPLGRSLRAEVPRQKLIASLLELPNEWHARLDGGLPTIFRTWSACLGVRLTGAELDEIQQTLDSHHRILFLEGVASLL